MIGIIMRKHRWNTNSNLGATAVHTINGNAEIKDIGFTTKGKNRGG
jgi:hypothetical protein